MEAADNEGQEQEQPGLIAQVQQFLDDDRKKWGGMTLGAMGRLGLAELREAVSLDSGNEGVTPYGMYGTLTPGEVAAGRREDSQEPQIDHDLSERQADFDMTPGDIGREGGVYGSSRDQGNDRDAAQPTPGDIAQDNAAYAPDQDPGRGQEQSRGR